MSDQQGEFLDMETIEGLAKEHLPLHYRLKKVHLDHESAVGGLVIRIEYECPSEDAELATLQDIRSHQGWANRLIQRIRTQWPSEAVTISFEGRESLDV